MKIALLGYGKMGKVIEKIAISRGHEIILKIDKDSAPYDITTVDVAIDFSMPNAAVKNISHALPSIKTQQVYVEGRHHNHDRKAASYYNIFDAKDIVHYLKLCLINAKDNP